MQGDYMQVATKSCENRQPPIAFNGAPSQCFAGFPAGVLVCNQSLGPYSDDVIRGQGIGIRAAC